MSYIIDHIPKTTANNRRPAIAMTAETITIHNTGNPRSTARAERNWLVSPQNSRQASYHIVIDDKETIECLPLNEVAWHAGDGRGNGNMKSIGIEICESGDYAKTLERATELVAKMLRERRWGTDRLRRHWDWSKKICPRLMYDNGTWKGWTDFMSKVENELNPLADLSHWAKDAWLWAIKEGLIDGKDPKGIITREQLITILYRMKNRP
jgi:N-acetylmuramoyl-L-alanine amidase